MDEETREQPDAQADAPEAAQRPGSDARPDREAVRPRQRIGLACLGGLIGVVVGAVLWGIVGSWLEVKAFWMAVVLGVVVGLSVRLLGRGREPVFGGLAVIFTLIGLIFGSLLMFLGSSARETGLPIAVLFAELQPPLDYLLVLQNGYLLLELENLKVYALLCDAVAPVVAFFLAFLRVPWAR